MTQNLDERKYRLIQEIVNMNDESSIARLEGQVESIHTKENAWAAAIKPIRKTITLQQMKEEQNYTPMDKETFFELAKKVEIEESIEDLLAMLD